MPTTRLLKWIGRLLHPCLGEWKSDDKTLRNRGGCCSILKTKGRWKRSIDHCSDFTSSCCPFSMKFEKCTTQFLYILSLCLSFCLFRAELGDTMESIVAVPFARRLFGSCTVSSPAAASRQHHTKIADLCLLFVLISSGQRSVHECPPLLVAICPYVH